MALFLATAALAMVNPMQQAKLNTLRADGAAAIARRESVALVTAERQAGVRAPLDFKAPAVDDSTVAALKDYAAKPTDYGFSMPDAARADYGPEDFVKLGAVAAVIGYIVYQQTL